MSNENTSLNKTYMAIIVAVVLYWTVSISMVFINKYLLSDLKIEAPLCLTWFQCVISIGLFAILSVFTNSYSSFMKLPSFKIDFKIVRDILPLSIIFVAMIIFNNLCLKNSTVSFYMIVRSLTTIFNIMFTYLFFKERTSFKAIICCLVIIIGFLFGIDKERGFSNLSWQGVFYGIAASVFVALYAIYTKRSLSAVDNNIWKLTLYNNFNACFILLPIILLLNEHQELINIQYFKSFYFWFAMFISGILGFLMSYATGLQIQVTSPLTHNVSGAAKAYVQTLLSVLYYNQMKSLLWLFSNLLVLTGAALYTQVRAVEIKEQFYRKSTNANNSEKTIKLVIINGDKNPNTSKNSVSK